MVERDTILKEKVWYVGIADFKEYYEYAWDWLTQEEDYIIIEEKYKEKHIESGKDMEIRWKATKEITDYFKIALDIAWKVLGSNDVEVETNGKKKKMQKMAECTITIKGILEKDYSNKWGAKNLICSEAVARILYDSSEKKIDFEKEFLIPYDLIEPMHLWRSKQIEWLGK